MSRSTKPRKRYRPKPVGRPIMQRMRDALIIPAYSALSALQLSSDADALESARHSLAALIDYVYVALRDTGRDTSTLAAALTALQSVVDRHASTGTYRATGDELRALRQAVTHADEVLPTLRTDEVMRACLEVDRILGRCA